MHWQEEEDVRLGYNMKVMIDLPKTLYGVKQYVPSSTKGVLLTNQ